jgi:carbonic anhydrase
MEKLNYQYQNDWRPEVGAMQSPLFFQKDNVKPMLGQLFDLSLEAQAIAIHDNLNNISIDGHGAVVVAGRLFQLQEIHFHHVAEHGFEGEVELRPLEAHLVHRNELGQVLVIGITFKIGATNLALQSILSGMQNNFKLEEKVDLNEWIPKSGNYYHYLGSLTTPPLTEGVEWIVFETPQTISLEQLDAYTDYFPAHNHRAFQKVNARVIQKYQIG